MRKEYRYHYGPMNDFIFDMKTNEVHYDGHGVFNEIIESGVDIQPFTGKRPLSIKDQIEQDIESAKKDAWSKLCATDWYFTRKLETGKEIPEQVKNQRDSIRKNLEKRLSALEEELRDEL